MLVSRFKATKLHGIFQFDIVFDKKLSLLHGINGGGKTTVLRSIASLLTPDINWIVNTEFQMLELQFEYERKNHIVTVTKTKDRMRITLNSKENVLVDEFSTSMISSLIDESVDYPFPYNPLSRVLEDSRALKYIELMPTPIYLGLDRTTIGAFDLQDDIQRYQGAPWGDEKSIRPTNRAILDDGLREADKIIRDKLRFVFSERDKLSVKFRENVVKTLFDMEDQSDRQKNVRPTRKILQDLLNNKREIITTFEDAQIGAVPLRDSVENFFNNVIHSGQELLEKTASNQDINRIMSDPSYQSVFFNWFNLIPRLSLLNKMVTHVKEFRKNDDLIQQDIRTFTLVVNNFLSDSSKELSMASGEARIVVRKLKESNVGCLSSGERQIFVLLTHLAFNERLKKSSILIVDEPELSLHMKWQEEFIGSIIAIDPKIQILIATHSPSIIGDRDQNCIFVEGAISE